MKRYWDPTNKSVASALTNYRYWAIEVSWCQHTLGSCVMYCRREGVRLLSELMDEELADMRDAMAAHEMRLRNRQAFRPDHINYLQNGDESSFLQILIVPRYKTSREEFGLVWIDFAWGSLPILSSEEISRPLMERIRDAFSPT
jgi:diadenosine tetraphosphate (Ap4A) HIT family hydrolase